MDLFLTALIQDELLNNQQADDLLEQAKSTQLTLVACLIQQNILSEATLAKALAAHLGLDFFDLASLHPDSLIQDMVDEAFIRAYQVLPLFIENHTLYLAISEPAHLDQVWEMKFHTDLNIKPVVVEWKKLAHLIQCWLNTRYRLSASNPSVLFEQDNQVIAWVEQLLRDAMLRQASDIHLEPYKAIYRIRFRLDGILHKMLQLPLATGNRIVASLKIMARLDMSEKRLPQDGRFTFESHTSKPKDCRISVCPTLFGEKIVIRILDAEKTSLQINDLGLEKAQRKIFLKNIQKPQGMILVTGPTGSGKTVTLYTALRFLNTLEKNICTVEEPVEITLPGINQINIEPKITLTFAKAMRAFLRQDPDILMVGEIRDQETADIAIKAAQTGHLVLSTLHTNRSVEALARLTLLGVSPVSLINSLHLIIAQRLLRKLCLYCKGTPQQTEAIDSKKIDKLSCQHCTKGYKGRVAVFECLPMSENIADLILQGKSSQEIEGAAHKAGMLRLKDAALMKVRSGITSLEETKRVIDLC